MMQQTLPLTTGSNMERIYHTWDKWECFPAGFYNERPPHKDWTDDYCVLVYETLLRNTPLFEAALQRVITEWVKSCEHYLSNERMNRIAWLGQASLCIAFKIPSRYRGGFNRLSDAEQAQANECALKYLNKWLASKGHKALTMEEAQSKTQADLY